MIEINRYTKDLFFYRKAEHWPQKLLMQLIPKTLISNFGGAHFRNARSVMFHPTECEALEALAKVMSTGYVSFD